MNATARNYETVLGLIGRPLDCDTTVAIQQGFGRLSSFLTWCVKLAEEAVSNTMPVMHVTYTMLSTVVLAFTTLLSTVTPHLSKLEIYFVPVEAIGRTGTIPAFNLGLGDRTRLFLRTAISSWR